MSDSRKIQFSFGVNKKCWFIVIDLSESFVHACEAISRHWKTSCKQSGHSLGIGSLDDDNADIIFSYLKEYTQDGGSVLLVSPDRKAAQYGTHVLNMKKGELLNN